MDLSSAGAAAHSRDVSVGYRQEGPGQHQPACPDESNQNPLPPAPPSSRLTQPALLPTAGLNTGQLSGRQLWFAFKQQQIPFSPAFFYLPVSSAHLFFLPPIVPLVPAAQPFYPSTAKPQGTSSMGPLDPSQPAALSGEAGYLVVLFRPCKGEGGDLEAFETIEGSRLCIFSSSTL